ncbi:helix-turn-helix domain-containing protein [Fodinicola feengrottensis]
MSITLDVSRSTAASLVRVGGRFMTGDQLATAARAQLIPTTGLYFRGRIGAVGEVPSPVATSLLGIFPHWLVERIWAETAAFPAAAAVSAYAGACTSWGAEALSGLERADQVVEVAEKVIDRAESTALPLFAGWRAAHRPAAGPGRAGYALMLLRELRGGLHFAALRAAGLDIPIAVIGDPTGGLPRLRQTDWRPEEIEQLQRRASTVPDFQRRWNAAEETTSVAFAGCLAVLTETELTELAELIIEADRISVNT